MASATTVCPNVYEFKPGRYSSHALLLNALPKNGSGLAVLDLGCASGYLSQRMAGRGFRVVAVDRPGMLPDEIGASVDFIGADLERGLPPVDGRFDFVVCADILEHLRDPARLLRDVRSVISPGGRLLASLPNSGHAYFRANVLMGRFPAHDRGLFDRTHLHFYTWAGWKNLLESAGFGVERVTPTSVPVGMILPRWEGTPLARGLERASFALACLRKTLFAYQFVVSAYLR